MTAGWRRSRGCSTVGSEDVLYVFHDPAQAIFRDDQIGELGLTEYPLDFNCRNAKPIHDADRAARPGRPRHPWPAARDGREPELITADVDAETIEALRKVLHRLVDVEGVAPGSIAVLSGIGLEAFGRLEAAPLRQPGPVERRGRRRRAAARAGGGGRPGAAEGRRPVRVDPPVQGPRAAGHRAARGAARRPGAAGSAAVHRGVSGHAAPGGDRAAGGGAAADDAVDVTTNATTRRALPG